MRAEAQEIAIILVKLSARASIIDYKYVKLFITHQITSINMQHLNNAP